MSLSLEDATKLIQCVLAPTDFTEAIDVFRKALELWPDTDWKAAIIAGTERPVEEQWEDWDYERRCLLADLSALKNDGGGMPMGDGGHDGRSL